MKDTKIQKKKKYQMWLSGKVGYIVYVLSKLIKYIIP